MKQEESIVRTKVQEDKLAAESLLRNTLAKLQITLPEHQQLQNAITILVRVEEQPQSK